MEVALDLIPGHAPLSIGSMLGHAESNSRVREVRSATAYGRYTMVGRTATRRAAWIGALGLAVSLVAGCSASSTNSSQRSPSLGRAGRPYAPNPPTGPAADGADGKTREGAGSAPEVDATEHPTSTFAMDVDTASYGYARRVLRDGRRPDAATVRPEEFINAFQQDYTEPAGNGFTVRADGAPLPGQQPV